MVYGFVSVSYNDAPTWEVHYFHGLRDGLERYLGGIDRHERSDWAQIPDDELTDLILDHGQ